MNLVSWAEPSDKLRTDSSEAQRWLRLVRRRALREGLDEETLALFYLLMKPDLSKKDIERLKAGRRGAAGKAQGRKTAR